jgi:hypothetical protein
MARIRSEGGGLTSGWSGAAEVTYIEARRFNPKPDFVGTPNNAMQLTRA